MITLGLIAEGASLIPLGIRSGECCSLASAMVTRANEKVSAPAEPTGKVFDAAKGGGERHRLDQCVIVKSDPLAKRGGLRHGPRGSDGREGR